MILYCGRSRENDAPIFFRAKQRSVMRLKKTEANAGLSSLLESAGFDPSDVRRYMELSTRSGTEAARARILRGQRGRLMDELHRRQQVLDKVDYLIWQAENGKQQKGR